MERSEADRRVYELEADWATLELVNWRRNYDLNQVLNQ
jgi:hypothetical protein